MVARFGGEHGHAASDDVTSIYYNPAGLAFGHGNRAYLEGTLAYRTVDYNRDVDAIDNPGTGTPDDGISANAGPAHLADTLVSPFVGAATDLGIRGLGLGFGVYAPFGGQADWDKNDAYAGNTTYPGAVDGTQRWANISGLQRSIYFTLGAAYATPEGKLAFGASLSAIRSQIDLVRARNATGTDDLLGEGRSLLEASDLTVGFGLGVMYRPDDKMTLGLSYQSRPGITKMSLDGTLTNRFGSGEVVQDVSLQQKLPDIVRFAVEIEVAPKVNVLAAFDWQHWSVFDNQCLIDLTDATPGCVFNSDGSLDTGNGGSGVVVNLPRNWTNTHSLRGGLDYQASAKLDLAASITYDTNAVPDETIDPSLFDMNKIVAQGTADIDVTDMIGVSATLGHVFYSDRTTQPRAVAPAPPSLNPDMAGTYAQSVSYLLLGVTAKL
ncbi:MAG: outer membrane protein transport protein [Kofleriaceae bacterium]|nr:outer membrane protein transport protein [Kofleriaceae bacterium]